MICKTIENSDENVVPINYTRRIYYIYIYIINVYSSYTICIYGDKRAEKTNPRKIDKLSN